MKRKQNLIDPFDYHNAVSKLRSFFMEKGFVEVPTQSRQSILAACEDPTTIASYNYNNQRWPLPQTGQMWLEYELLKNPDASGFFCISTSYRQEQNPIEGRHETIFPMFEFESRVGSLYSMERDLLEYMGFGDKYCFPTKEYEDVCSKYKVDTIEAEHEERLHKEYGPVVFLQNFPFRTSPFWNMKTEGEIANKIDVIMYGMETIGSAERSCDPEKMRYLFHTISDGQYANILYNKFGKNRVEKELEEFLSYDFFPRFGGGIGLTRMIRAMKLHGI